MTTNTTIASDYALSDHAEEHLRIEPSLPLPGKLFIGIEDHSLDEDTQGTGRYVHIDADKVRYAIDKAMGSRRKDELYLEQSSIYGQVAMHPVFDDCWTPDSTPSADAMIEKLDRLAEAEGNGTKVYPARHRDRHLRHIGDLEATLTRRNERHERDQERIRELEAEVALSEAKRKIIADMTPRELLDVAWERAHAPEDGMIYKGEEAMVMVHGRGDGPGVVIRGSDIPSRPGGGVEYRLLEPRPEPTVEERRQALIDEHELEDWKIELLKGAA